MGVSSHPYQPPAALPRQLSPFPLTIAQTPPPDPPFPPSPPPPLPVCLDVTPSATSYAECAGALDEVDWLRNKLERLETSISAMARTAGSVGPEGGSGGVRPQSPAQPGQQPTGYRYEK